MSEKTVMNYLTFVLKDPDTLETKCVGVKYKKTSFTEVDLARIVKTGTLNADVKKWIKDLSKEDKAPLIEILYKGSDSATACYHKQKVLIEMSQNNSSLVGLKTTPKKYTKNVRSNIDMRRPIVDQFGEKYPGVLEAGEKLLLAPSNISKVLHGKLEHIGGYKFTFAD